MASYIQNVFLINKRWRVSTKVGIVLLIERALSDQIAREGFELVTSNSCVKFVSEFAGNLSNS